MKSITTALLCLGLVYFAGTAPQASAALGITSFDGMALRASGAASSEAGAHPDTLSTSFSITTQPNPIGFGVSPSASIKDVEVDPPPGLVGNADAVPKCVLSNLEANACPDNAAIGVARYMTNGVNKAVGPLFNMVPPAGAPAQFAFNSGGVIIFLTPRLRTGDDYGLSVDSLETSQAQPITSASVTLWGVPADSSHDGERGKCVEGNEPDFCPSGMPRVSFLRNPTKCTAPNLGLKTTLRINSWEDPAEVAEASFNSHLPPPQQATEVGVTGCDVVPFHPALAAAPTSAAADSPTGLTVDVTMPQVDNPDGVAEADLRKAVVALPEGMAVNPSSANGLGSCSEAQVDLSGAAAATCPDNSKLGNVEIESPLLDRILKGGIYLARQGENKFGSLLAIYLAIDDPKTGLVVKLPGKVAPDPQSGRLIATFDENPQLPFERLHVEFLGGSRASLLNPPNCGSYQVRGEFSPWSSNPAVTATSTFQITTGPDGKPCPSGQFDPKLSAGTTNPVAGAYSPFVFSLSREDGSQRLGSLSVTLPKGLLGKLRGTPYCPDSTLALIPSAEGAGAAQLASPSCPAASQVGTVSVGAGAGPNPFYANTGRAYLAGPYKGAPLSLAVVTPALAGPFDLGSVVVRNALQVDPATAQITAVSDPLPTILHGIPLDLRSINVSIDRPDFTLNPTSCDPMFFSGSATAPSGASARLSDRFQVGACEWLPFKPSLKLKVSGATKRGAYPKLRAELRAKPGEANIGRVSVALPHSEFLAQEHIRTICTRVQYAADACPAGSIYGHARAITPLLDQPLEGPVYLRSSSNPLPDLVVALKGQIEIDLAGRIDSVNGGIRNSFELVPDAPVSKFVLEMKGGKKGLLVNSRDLCKGTNRATVRMDGQNGKVFDARPVLRGSCGKARKGAQR